MGYPDNAAFAVTGYVIASVVVLVYTVSLYLRIRKEH